MSLAVFPTDKDSYTYSCEVSQFYWMQNKEWARRHYIRVTQILTKQWEAQKTHKLSLEDYILDNWDDTIMKLALSLDDKRPEGAKSFVDKLRIDNNYLL